MGPVSIREWEDGVHLRLFRLAPERDPYRSCVVRRRPTFTQQKGKSGHTAGLQPSFFQGI